MTDQIDDNPPITCPYCGSTDQEYIYHGEWVCGDCNEHWNERWKDDDSQPATGDGNGDQRDEDQRSRKPV